VCLSYLSLSSSTGNSSSHKSYSFKGSKTGIWIIALVLFKDYAILSLHTSTTTSYFKYKIWSPDRELKTGILSLTLPQYFVEIWANVLPPARARESYPAELHNLLRKWSEFISTKKKLQTVISLYDALLAVGSPHFLYRFHPSSGTLITQMH
jgi:hypothetical protein